MPALQLRKLRLRDVAWLARGHRVHRALSGTPGSQLLPGPLPCPAQGFINPLTRAHGRSDERSLRASGLTASDQTLRLLEVPTAVGKARWRRQSQRTLQKLPPLSGVAGRRVGWDFFTPGWKAGALLRCSQSSQPRGAGPAPDSCLCACARVGSSHPPAQNQRPPSLAP